MNGMKSAKYKSCKKLETIVSLVKKSPRLLLFSLSFFEGCTYSMLLSQSSSKLLISLDLVSMKFYCFRARVHIVTIVWILFSQPIL